MMAKPETKKASPWQSEYKWKKRWQAGTRLGRRFCKRMYAKTHRIFSKKLERNRDEE